MNMLSKATLITSALLFGLSLSTASYAGKIYLWYTTDQNGNRVPKYGETPPKGVEATLVSESKSPSSSTPPAPAGDAPSEAVSEQQKQLQDQRKQECAAEEQRLNTLETSGSRIRMTGADGNSRYLTPDEIIKEIEASKDFLKSACSK